jgi:hypothetical protein
MSLLDWFFRRAKPLTDPTQNITFFEINDVWPEINKLQQEQGEQARRLRQLERQAKLQRERNRLQHNQST